MTPGFKDGDGGGVGEVEAALTGLHGQAQPPIFRKAVAQIRRQAGGFLAKNENIVFLQVDRKKIATALGCHREHPSVAKSGLATVPVRMAHDVGVLVIIEPGAATVFVAEVKAQRFDQMQFSAGIGAHADDIAGVGRDFRLVKDDGKHGERSEKIKVRIRTRSVLQRTRYHGHTHLRRAIAPEHARTLIGRVAGGQDIVDEQDGLPMQRSEAGEGTFDIARPLLEGKLGLRWGGALADQDFAVNRDIEPFFQGAGEFERLIEAPFAQTRGVQWHGNNSVYLLNSAAFFRLPPEFFGEIVAKPVSQQELMTVFHGLNQAVNREVIGKKGSHVAVSRRSVQAGAAAFPVGGAAEADRAVEPGQSGQIGLAGRAQKIGTACADGLVVRACCTAEQAMWRPQGTRSRALGRTEPPGLG